MQEYSINILREKGVRVTPQRAHIWRILAESGEHLTAEETWQAAKSLLPGLELSTVYRTLEALEEAGLVVEIRLPEGPMVYEARPTMHPHLLCESCGNIFHAEAEVDKNLLEALSVGMEGFEVRELHVVASGVCAVCAQNKRRGG